MKSKKPTYSISPQACRAEAASALRGHWAQALFVTFLLTFIMLLPSSALILTLSSVSSARVSYYGIYEALRFYLKIFGYIALSSLVTFLLSPIQIIAQNRLSVHLLFDKPIDLPSISATRREWFLSLRVLFLKYVHSAWPLFAGCAAFFLLSRSFPLPRAAQIAAGIFTSALAVWALIRYVSCTPAQHFIFLFPEDNARTLLKNSRRFMKGYTKDLFRLLLSFLVPFLIFAFLPVLLVFLPVGLIPPLILPVAICAAGILLTLPVIVYAGVSIAVFILHLPVDR